MDHMDAPLSKERPEPVGERGSNTNTVGLHLRATHPSAPQIGIRFTLDAINAPPAPSYHARRAVQPRVPRVALARPHLAAVPATVRPVP